jgi:hypothetical protein
MITINIASPAGSGVTFAVDLINKSFDSKSEFGCVSLGHERKDFEGKTDVVLLLRNPYDAIASGAERWIDTSGHQDFKGSKDLVSIDNINGIKKVIGWEEKRYLDFFEGVTESENLKIYSFDFLTENNNLFLDKLKKDFNIHSDNAIYSTESEIIESMVSNGRTNRAPRAKTNARLVIDSLMIKMYPKETWRCWKNYLEIKSKLKEDIIDI